MQIQGHLTEPHVYCKVFEDNSGALELAKLPKMQPCTKHINMPSSLLWACQKGTNKYFSYLHKRTDSWHFHKATVTKFFFTSQEIHLWTVITTDITNNIGRECEVIEPIHFVSCHDAWLQWLSLMIMSLFQETLEDFWLKLLRLFDNHWFQRPTCIISARML